MKKYFLLGVLSGVLLVSNIYAIPIIEYRKVLKTEEIQSQPLALREKLDVKDMLKSAPQQHPIQVIQTDTALEVLFLRNIGNLTIIVINELGFSVYQQTVNAMNGSILKIGTSSWASNNCFIMFTNNQGGSLGGAFKI